ncbi:Lactose permease [Fusarium oxysporum f. sp. albedinis]|nr:Lactose permease [Fusarium oxysporum f. sp. albedinis]
MSHTWAALTKSIEFITHFSEYCHDCFRSCLETRVSPSTVESKIKHLLICIGPTNQHVSKFKSIAQALMAIFQPRQIFRRYKDPTSQANIDRSSEV